MREGANPLIFASSPILIFHSAKVLILKLTVNLKGLTANRRAGGQQSANTFD
jgi:hypothetical protein